MSTLSRTLRLIALPIMLAVMSLGVSGCIVHTEPRHRHRHGEVRRDSHHGNHRHCHRNNGPYRRMGCHSHPHRAGHH